MTAAAQLWPPWPSARTPFGNGGFRGDQGLHLGHICDLIEAVDGKLACRCVVNKISTVKLLDGVAAHPEEILGLLVRASAGELT